MGLDMFLYAERIIRYDEDTLNTAVASQFPDLPKGISVRQVDFEVGYWRKANAVHNWFVHNVQGGEDECNPFPVSKEQIQELKDLCQKVIDNPKKAATLLPSRSGFFFGGTEYDEFYFNDVAETIEICDRALALSDKYSLFYRSSW